MIWDAVAAPPTAIQSVPSRHRFDVERLAHEDEYQRTKARIADAIALPGNVLELLERVEALLTNRRGLDDWRRPFRDRTPQVASEVQAMVARLRAAGRAG